MATTESMFPDRSDFDYDYETLRTTGLILAIVMFVSGILIALTHLASQVQRQKFHLRLYKVKKLHRCLYRVHTGVYTHFPWLFCTSSHSVTSVSGTSVLNVMLKSWMKRMTFILKHFQNKLYKKACSIRFTHVCSF